ncbi:hypothetical protein ACTAQJ_14635 [Arthrobacter sp. alpha11c]
MKSDAAGSALRKLVENLVILQRHNAVSLEGVAPLEKFHDDFAMLAFPITKWAVGLRVGFTTDAWSIKEILLLPLGRESGPPPLGGLELESRVDATVRRARDRQQVEAEQVKQMKGNASFVEGRFEAWRDKTVAKTNVEYAALAAKYAEQIRLGNSRATATLAELVDMSPAVMAQRIKEARRRFLLTPGERGKASGSLTPLGALLTDPDFPGFRRLRMTGMTQREIAEKYGINEQYVWHGLIEDRGPDEDRVLLVGDEQALFEGLAQKQSLE